MIRRKEKVAFLIMMLVFFNTMNVFSQNVTPSKVEFINAPVLFKENGKSFQQVIASYRSEEP